LNAKLLLAPSVNVSMIGTFFLEAEFKQFFQLDWIVLVR